MKSGNFCGWIVIVMPLDAGEILPAESVALAVSVWEPADRLEVGATDHAPDAGTVALVPIKVAPSNTLTVEPTSAVPLISGLSSSVVMPSAGLVIIGAAGGTVSTVIVLIGLVAELPALSVALATIVWLPSESADDGTKDHDVVPVASWNAPESMLTSTFCIPDPPASAEVPVMFGCVELIDAPAVGELINTVGTIVSTVIETAVDFGDTFPDASVAVATRL